MDVEFSLNSLDPEEVKNKILKQRGGEMGDTPTVLDCVIGRDIVCHVTKRRSRGRMSSFRRHRLL